MDTQTILANVLSPAALFFALGFLAVLLHSDLELPYPLPKFFSTYLLISIGYTGGEKLAHAGLTTEVAATIAAAMAATYGSISIVTFVVGTEFLNRQQVGFGGHMVAVMSMMESPAVIMGPTAGEGLKPFMTGLFKGIVLLFLLDVGMLAARKAEKLVEVGPKLVAFGILAPLANTAIDRLWA